MVGGAKAPVEPPQPAPYMAKEGKGLLWPRGQLWGSLPCHVPIRVGHPLGPPR